jgi:hypothetical protein
MSCATSPSFKEKIMIQKNHIHHVVEFIVGLLFGVGLML